MTDLCGAIFVKHVSRGLKASYLKLPLSRSRRAKGLSRNIR